MPHASAAHADASTKQSLAIQVRDTLVLSESLIVELVNEVLTSQPAHKAEFFRRQLKSNPGLGASIKRVVVDIGVVLSLAKSLESDDEFSDSAALVHDIDFAAHDGAVGAFAKAMVECDLQSLANVEGEVAVLYELLPADVLERRLRLILAFLDQMMKRAH
jgi:hypothetical protein